MPTVSLSSRLSDAVYLVAILGLSILLARPVYTVFYASQERGAETVCSGLAVMIDSMSPGTVVTARLESYPAVDLSVGLSGRTLTAHLGGSSSSSRVVWDLQTATLTPGKTYVFTLSGGEVSVEQARDG